MLHQDIVKTIRQFFQELFGADLVLELFVSSVNKFCMFDSLINDVNSNEGHGVFVNGDWSKYSDIIPWIAEKSVIAIIIAPMERTQMV